MTSEGFWEMFEGDSGDTCAGKLMRGRAEGLACADPGARTPIGASGHLGILFLLSCLVIFLPPLFKTTEGVVVGLRIRIIPLAPMGVLAPGSAHARPSTRPPIERYSLVNLIPHI